jgi:glycosyltransferase involved in cell wall biosynthesis
VLGPPPAPDQRAQAAAVAGLRLVETAQPLDWLAAHPAALRAAGEAVAALAREVAADLVHLNSPALAAEARFDAPVVAVCHSCLATWWEAVRSGPPPEEFRWRTRVVASGYAAADALIAPSAAFAAATARAYGLAAPPRIVHNGRAALSAPAAAAPEQAVLTAGRLWDEGKDVATIDRAAARLSVPVLAAGPLEGPNGTRLAPRHAVPLGRLGDAALRRRLARAPVFVSAARYEPFGLAVLEAAQAGCALVLSDIPTFRELWHGTAEFAPPGDDAAFADAVERLLRDPVRRAARGSAASARAGRFTVEAMTEGVLDTYRAVLREAVA